MEKGGGGNLEMGISRAKPLAGAFHHLLPIAPSARPIASTRRPIGALRRPIARRASVLHLMVHHIEDKPIQRQQALGRGNLLGGTGDVALPVASVQFGENWVAKHRPGGIQR